MQNFGNNFVSTGDVGGTFANAFAATYSNGGTVGIAAPSVLTEKKRVMFYLKGS